MKNRSGFTLVELIIVAAIIVLLSFYSIPKYYELTQEARSSQAQATVGTVRSALGIYYAKNRGIYPAALDGTLFAEGSEPDVEVTVGGVVKRSNLVLNIAGNGIVTSDEITNAGGWVYDVSSKRENADVRINSTDTDPITHKHWYEF